VLAFRRDEGLAEDCIWYFAVRSPRFKSDADPIFTAIGYKRLLTPQE